MREPQLTERREGLSSAHVSAENGNQHSRETQEAGAEGRPPQPCRKPTFQRCPPTQAHLPSQTKAFQSAVFEQTFDQLLSNYQSMQTTG